MTNIYFSLGTSPATLLNAFRPHNFLSKFTPFSRSASDLTQSIDDGMYILLRCVTHPCLEDEKETPQKQMIREIEEYEISFKGKTVMVTPERAKFVCRIAIELFGLTSW